MNCNEKDNQVLGSNFFLLIGILTVERKYEPPTTAATKGTPVNTNFPFLDLANCLITFDIVAVFFSIATTSAYQILFSKFPTVIKKGNEVVFVTSKVLE